MPDPRFTRQVRLAEVGREGQARLLEAGVRVAGAGTTAAIEARYLRGAGVRVLASPSAEAAVAGAEESVPGWLRSLHPAAREVAGGAYAALTVVRAILGDRPHPRVLAR